MAINVKDKLITLESLGVAYSAEQDAREEADQALSTRIDNIVAPEGDPSLTEVSDARVSGSTTYPTLKARLDADRADIDGLKADSGDLSDLDTTDKSSIVAAINEVAQTGGADAVSLLKEQIYNSYPNVEAETGSIVSISDGAGGIPVKSLVVGIKPAQAGSGDPSPTNVRPISGWTGLEVTVSPTTDAEDGDTYNITFPSEAGTVYGGTLDVTTGVLTVNSAIVDMGTLNWMYYSAQQRIVAQVNAGKPAGDNVGLDGACSVYKVVNTAYRSAPDKSIVIGNNFISNSYAAMVVHDEDYTDAATFKTAVSGQKLVFPIKTPVTYQLTPTEVTTLLGTNNIWADTGDCAVEYRADTKLYIDRVYVDYRTMLAPVESTYIATRNYTVGQLLIVGNTLYKVTANIANGGNITPNTNVTATTLSEVISALA